MLQSLRGPTGQVRHVAWTDLNRTLISAGQDGIVRRWDVEVSLLPPLPSSPAAALHWPPPPPPPFAAAAAVLHLLAPFTALSLPLAAWPQHPRAPSSGHVSAAVDSGFVGSRPLWPSAWPRTWRPGRGRESAEKMVSYVLGRCQK